MPTFRVPSKALRALVPALSLFLASCMSSAEFYRTIEENVARGNYADAIQEVRAHRNLYGDKAAVLYHLDLGTFYHYSGEADSSSFHLLAAEREMEDLYTRSISLAALSMILNDNILPYEGEDFEKVLVNVFLALNFAAKDQPDEAVVEARKVDLKLRELARLYEGKNTYQEDALARYLAGACYENAGETNDAFISYKKAFETYSSYARDYGTPTPGFLLNDLVRTGESLSFTDEVESYRALGGVSSASGNEGAGSVIVVAYAGRGPVKTEVRPTVSIADDSGIIHTFQIALPRFTPRFKGPRKYTVEARKVADSTVVAEASTELAEDVTAIAYRDLEDRLGLIYLKSGGRALLKFLAAEKAKSAIRKNGDETLLNVLGSIAVDLAVGATEQADVRGWRTLPAQVQLARLHLPAGTYRIAATASDSLYRLPGERITVRSGKTTFVIVDDIR